MKKQEEIQIVKKYMQASDGQIQIDEVGWTSRVYFVDDGRIIFKFPRNKQAQEELKHEIKVLELLENYAFNLKTQIVKWKGDNSKYVGYLGVPGQALTPKTMMGLDGGQKEKLGQQLGTFLKKLHSIKGFKNPNGAEQDQIDEYQGKYRDNRSIFEQHFNVSEMAFIDELFLKTAPIRINELGKDIVFCHGDFGYNNILLDGDIRAGVIDFGDAGLNDRSVDFVDFDDEIILNAALESYGDSSFLREKIAIRQKIFPIFLLLFYIDRRDIYGLKQSVAGIKRVIYSNCK